MSLDTVDVAIVTALPEEFSAVRSRLNNSHPHEGTLEDPRLYGWVLGEVDTTINRPYRIVLARVPHAGQVPSAIATLTTIKRWKPRYIFFVGIAGGFQKNDAKLHDIIISDVIWGYEYGKIGDKGLFKPRHDLTYRCDSALLTAITDFADHTAWREDSTPKEVEYHVGPVASGDKVVDETDKGFFKSILDAWPKLVAVEMEGVGAASATAEAVSSGILTSFLMIRVVSDVPDSPEEDEVGTQSRDTSKRFVSSIAAQFACKFIGNGLPTFPVANSTPGSDGHSKKETLSSPEEAAINGAANFLFKSQRPDGGVPATKLGQGSGCWTTASAVESVLLAFGHKDTSKTFADKACHFLLEHQLSTGGWSLVIGPFASTMATGHAVSALITHKNLVPDFLLAEQRQQAIERGFQWIEKNHLPEGGWGVEPEGSGEGREFRIVSTFYALRPYLLTGQTVSNSCLVSDTANSIAELQSEEGFWSFISGRKRRPGLCVSNTSRAISLLVKSGLHNSNDVSIQNALKLIIDNRFSASWRLSTEGFYEEESHAQNIYHNNTPCDAINALIDLDVYPDIVNECIHWMLNDQTKTGAWVLHSPDESQSFYEATTWPTAEFLYALGSRFDK